MRSSSSSRVRPGRPMSQRHRGRSSQWALLSSRRARLESDLLVLRLPQQVMLPLEIKHLSDVLGTCFMGEHSHTIKGDEELNRGGPYTDKMPIATGRGTGQTGPVRPRGVLQEIQALVVGFFTSLMPGESHSSCIESCIMHHAHSYDRVAL